MRKGYFQAFGVLVLWLSAPLPLIAADLMVEANWPPSRFVLVAFAIVIGVGLLNLRKWAALYFSVPLFWIGLSWALSAVQEIAFPWNLFWMAHGVSLMLPLYVTIRVWSRLSRGGKWYF
jgi:hypothetical protein